MIATIRNVSLASSQDWRFLGRSPSGLGALSWTCGVSTIARASVCGAPREGEFAFADGEISRVDDFRRDVHAVFHLERDQVRPVVLDLIESGLVTRGRADVGETIV